MIIGPCRLAPTPPIADLHKVSSDVSTTAQPASRLAWLDAWMAQHPWHPRIVPFLVYGAFLALIDLVRPHLLPAYPLLYVVQCSVVLWLILRYRHLMPELTLSFHWLSLPVAAAVAWAWVQMGCWMIDHFPDRYAADGLHYFEKMDPAVRGVSTALRLIGMSVIVPMLEEPFVRSLVLRSMHRFRTTLIAAVQFILDLPVIGDMLMHTQIAARADRHARVLGNQFDATPLGKLSFFGVFISTLIFVSYHAQRDWPAAVLCGVAYCLLLAATRRKGLGPVIWAHGLTNAFLWTHALYTGDWQFL